MLGSKSQKVRFRGTLRVRSNSTVAAAKERLPIKMAVGADRQRRVCAKKDRELRLEADELTVSIDPRVSYQICSSGVVGFLGMQCERGVWLRPGVHIFIYVGGIHV